MKIALQRINRKKKMQRVSIADISIPNLVRGGLPASNAENWHITHVCTAEEDEDDLTSLYGHFLIKVNYLL